VFYQKGVTPAIANPPEGGVWRCLAPLPRPLLAVCLFGFTPHSYAHLYTHDFTFASLHHHHHQLTRSHYYYYNTFYYLLLLLFLIPFLLLFLLFVCFVGVNEAGAPRGENLSFGGFAILLRCVREAASTPQRHYPPC
jgi:hypothetical protein